MDVETLYNRGFEHRCQGQYGEARQLLQQVLAVDPNHKGAHHQLALIAGFEGDFDGSLLSLSGLVEKFPEDNNLRYDFAMTQMMLGDYEAGCRNLKIILASDPTHEKALQQSIYCP